MFNYVLKKYANTDPIGIITATTPLGIGHLVHLGDDYYKVDQLIHHIGNYWSETGNFLSEGTHTVAILISTRNPN
jgi:hypothetical protein